MGATLSSPGRHTTTPRRAEKRGDSQSIAESDSCHLGARDGGEVDWLLPRLALPYLALALADVWCR
jgi:hypothetical protein